MTEQQTHLLGSLWIKTNARTSPQPWVSLVELPERERFLLPASDNFREIEEIKIAGAMVAPDLPGEKVMAALPLTASLGALADLRARPGESLLVVGASPWSRFFVLSGELLSLVPIAWVVEESEVRKCGEVKPPACELISAGTVDAVDRLKILTARRGFDMVVETTGNDRLLEIALGAAGVGGKVGLLGLSSGVTALDLHNTVHFKELAVRGLWEDVPPFSRLKKEVERGVLTLAVEKTTEGVDFKRAAGDIEKLREKAPGFIIVSGDGSL